MKAKITWLENMTMVGESGSGHAMIMDGPPAIGGKDLGIRPMEMVLLGLGGCTTVDVISILKKARQQVSHCRVEIEAERADSEPKVFTKIHVHFIVTGKNLKQTQVQRAVDLSAEKYCSVSIMLGKSVEISHSLAVLECQ